ncbi:MAG: dTDP-4-dehydrorhamnose 3,5-epimerase [Anaerolineaceae bacterium]|nr:dTDP-4-dehydrorhamnose 3,5-epimerase [Anaerolineaceae bacterium]
MKFKALQLPEVIEIEPRVFRDERGYFMETFQFERFSQNGIDQVFVQDNQSGSQQGILRGLHYQINHPQGKLVRVVTGEIFDVAVDIRRNSPTFGQWVGSILSESNKKQLWIPPGFAHGFLTLSSWAEIHYKCTDYYHPDSERTIIWNDAAINILWPFINQSLPVVSEKDSKGMVLGEADLYE